MNESKNDLPISEKAVLKPKEFAAIFGRQQVWAYRQIYAGKVKVLTHLGRMMIPKSEIARLLEAQHVYNGPEKEPFKDAMRSSKLAGCPQPQVGKARVA